MNNKLDRVNPEIFIPISEIEGILGTKFEISCLHSYLLKRDDPILYNGAIERSVNVYIPAIIPNLPENLFKYRLKSEFYSKLTKFLSKEYPKLLKPPQEQIRYSSEINNITFLKLYLANTLENELFLSDIFLQNPFITSYEESLQISNGYQGLKHGIFDQILVNIEKFARLYDYSQIGLMASNELSMQIFKRRGFSLDNTFIAEYAKVIKQGYPMTKVLS
jgi:hypothetical protein